MSDHVWTYVPVFRDSDKFSVRHGNPGIKGLVRFECCRCGCHVDLQRLGILPDVVKLFAPTRDELERGKVFTRVGVGRAELTDCDLFLTTYVMSS